MKAVSPGTVKVKSATLNGEDVTDCVHDFKVWTSIFKPYRVGELIVLDSNNLINRMKLKGNEDFEISFSSGGSEKQYKAKMKTTVIGNVNDFPSSKAQGFKIRMADEMHYKNQTTKISRAFSDITGTDVIKKIFDDHLKSSGSNSKLNIIKPSKGNIGTKQQKFIRANEYPLASISSVLKYLYANESGNYVFFQDDDGDFHCGPLAEIVKQGKNGGMKFTRRPTVGSDASDINAVGRNIYGLYIPEKGNPSQVYRNHKDVIPDCKTAMAEEYDPGRKKSKIETDEVIGKPGTDGDKYESQENRNVINTVWDGKLFKNHPHYQTMGQRYLYSQILQNGPSYSMTVMGDSGIDLLVGKGVDAEIPTPSGDQKGGDNQLKGAAIVANSMKHIRPYDVVPQFQCTFDCFRGGLN